jgi:pimeloyl-ACP methyl ester carboxylesterase
MRPGKKALNDYPEHGADIGIYGVSRGGRPDLASNHLHMVRAPTLLIVGGNDRAVIELNRSAFDVLKAEKKLEIIKGASHLFEEPGTLDRVAQLSIDWFNRFLQDETKT